MTLSIDIDLDVATHDVPTKFKVPAGITVLFGPSGVGKSTLLNTVAGLRAPKRGEITLNGRVLVSGGKTVPTAQRRIGYVFQTPRLFPHMTVRRNLAYGATKGGMADQAELIRLLNVGDVLDRLPHTLSGGEAQRIALARALLSNPECLLMDEPLSALDGGLKAKIYPYLETLRDRFAIPIVYVTHDVSELARLADRVVVLDKTGVLAQGDVHDILSNPAYAPYFGPQDMGSVVMGSVTSADAASGYTQIAVGQCQFKLPYQTLTTGTPVRMRIAAQDVILALSKPDDISAVNVLQAVVTNITQGKGPSVIVQLELAHADGAKILARITRSSANRLGLCAGRGVYAIVKASTFAPGITTSG